MTEETKKEIGKQLVGLSIFIYFCCCVWSFSQAHRMDIRIVRQNAFVDVSN